MDKVQWRKSRLSKCRAAGKRLHSVSCHVNHLDVGKSFERGDREIFSEEANIIKKALNSHSDILEEEFGSPSQSDVVRAGLHLLAEKTPKEQAMLIAKHKGRGRT